MTRITTAVFVAVALTVVFTTGRTARCEDTQSPPADARRAPARFEENRGQAGQGWRFLARTADATAWIAGDGALLRSPGSSRAVRLRFVGGDPAARTVAEGRQATVVNYLRGRDPAAWITGVPAFDSVRAHAVYTGVDVHYQGPGRRFRFDLVVAPGVDPAVVRLALEGADAVSLGDDGAVDVELGGRVLRLEAPVAFQERDGVRQPVEVRFARHADGALAFELGDYDRERELVIDPTVRTSSFLGGSADDRALDVAVNGAGDAFVCGVTHSTNLPTTSQAVMTTKGGSGTTSTDGFVMRFHPTLAVPVYVTYLGGGGDDACGAVAPGPSGTVYVAGDADSSDFPIVNGSAWPNASRAFAACLAADGRSLEFSTYESSGLSADVASDSDGDGYFLVSENGGFIVRKRSSSGAAVGSAASVHVGDGYGIAPRALAVDSTERVVVVGSFTSSSFAASSGVYDGSFGGSSEGFVMSLASGSGSDWTGYLGGGGDDTCTSVAIGPSDDVFVAGVTSSSDFPLTSAAQTSLAGGTEAFVARLDADGGGATFSTYLGGSGDDEARGIAVLDCGDSVVVGVTDSTDFPKVNASQSNIAGGDDAFYARHSASGSRLDSTWHGGASDDAANAVAFGDGGVAVAVGETASSAFPVRGSAYRTSLQGGVDGFFAAFQETATAFTVTTQTLPEWTVGETYTAQIQRSGGTSPFTWSVASGALPDGLTLGSDGAVTGTLGSTGSFRFRARVTDACGRFAVSDLTILVNARPFYQSLGLPGWTVGLAYDQSLRIGGGTPPLTISLADGAVLPPGTSFDEDLGRLHGIVDTVGSYPFDVTVTDLAGVSVTSTFTVDVNALPTIAPPATLPPCTEGRPYLHTFVHQGGTPPYTWTLIAGSLPATAGLQVAQDDAKIEGVARAAGPYAFTLRLTDALGVQTERAFTATVNPLPVIVTTELAQGARGRPWSAGVRASFGTPPFTFAVREDTLPGGSELDPSTGDITGTPSQEGLLSVKFVVYDACGASALKDFQVYIAPVFHTELKVTSQTLDFADVSEHRRYLELLEGAKIDVTAKLNGKGSFPIELAIRDNAGVEADLTGIAKTGKKKAQVKGFVAPASGRYFVVVRTTGEFTGSVRFDVKVAAQRVFKGSAVVSDTVVGAPATAATPPGSYFTIKVKRGKRSFVTPVVGTPRDGPDVLDTAFGKFRNSTKSASYKHPEPLANTHLSVVVDNLPGTEGSLDWTIVLKVPKLYDVSFPDLPSGTPIEPE